MSEPTVDTSGAVWEKFSDEDLRVALREGETKAIREAARLERWKRQRRRALAPKSYEAKNREDFRNVLREHPVIGGGPQRGLFPRRVL